ncbi:BMP family ABC transporter substrate-binding protein [Sinorhizobium meliloti]|uniref:BMP family lipoprotein n=1 Tax=Rhizobium meliloti TaxID=382 RepID=UPI0012966C87|nr:BMP family protein [Sinorhizobium meliloti]MQW13077.1 BMP family ABC transporter substrate-binding protein [Sinorhizobium meliloti]
MPISITRRAAILGSMGAVLLPATYRASASEPQELRLAIILESRTDVGWTRTLLDSLERVKEAKPAGLDISWEYTDPLWNEDAENAMRFYAESGEYDVIWAHGRYSDQVKNLNSEFPDVMFVVTGSGNLPLGANQYWLYKRLHEPSYLLGMLAGRTTKSGVIGLVGTFAADDVNDQINAYLDGARSVRPDVQHRISFIGSWSDNALAAEHANVQIASGADVVFMLTDNFKPCQEHQIMCFANINDQSKLAPDAIASSAIISWDPDINWIVEEWLKHKSGGPFSGNAEPKWFSMAQGGADIAPYHEFDAKLPAEVKEELALTRKKIISGEFVVPLNTAEVK